jgi:nucleoside-diphosphate-sugar epimerase
MSSMATTDWRDARVLITGARGFIGAHLCRRLLAAGAVVHGVTSRNNFADRLPHVEWLTVDLTDLSAVRQMMRTSSPDVVFHLAGHVTGSQALADVEPTYAQNLTSTVNLLICAAETGRPRVLVAGSMHEPNGEDPEAIPSSPYAASKWACTAYARMFHRLYQFPVVIARPMMVYGPGQWDVTKLLPYVITSLLNGKSPSVSSGTRTLDWIFIDDVVDAMMVLTTTAETHGKTIDLGSGILTSIREIILQVANLSGSSAPISFGSVPDRSFELPRMARIEETRRLTGWSAKTSLIDGLRKTIESWRLEVRNSVSSPRDVEAHEVRDAQTPLSARVNKILGKAVLIGSQLVEIGNALAAQT